MTMLRVAVWLEDSDEEFVLAVEADDDVAPTDLDGPIKEWALSRLHWRIERGMLDKDGFLAPRAA